MNTEKRLGFRTFIFYIFQWTLIPIFLMIISPTLPSAIMWIISIVPLNLSTINMPQVAGMFAAAIFFISALVAVIGFIMSIVKHYSISYTMGDTALKMRRGIIGRSEISIPYNQIQNVDVNQSIVFRMFGLSNLMVLSSGEYEGSKGNKTDEVFSIIDYSLAHDLREELLKRASIQKVKQV